LLAATFKDIENSKNYKR